jgi:hypothetical protein
VPIADAPADRVVGDPGGRGLDAAGDSGPGVSDVSPPQAPRACQPGQRMACYGGPAGTAEVGSCRSGERSCGADGSWSACLAERRPAAEQCNGADDDCDGVTDDGCPVDGALLRTAQRGPPSPVLGSLTLPGAVTFTHACPDGQVIVALTGNYGSGIDSLGVRCGRLQVRADRSVTPYRYDLLVAPGQELAPRGGGGGIVNGVDQKLRCPPGEVMVGLSAWLDPDAAQSCPTDYCPFTGTLCASVYGLTVSCAAYQLQGAAPDGFRVVRRGAAHTASERIGAVNGVGEVENPYACPAEAMLQELIGAYGIWPLDCRNSVINGLQLTCNSPSVPVAVAAP